MKKYLVHVMYDVAKASPGGTTPGALAQGWGPGHRFSGWTQKRLVVQAEVRAESESAAIEVADVKVRALWAHRPGGAITLTLSRATRERVLVGARRRIRRGVQVVTELPGGRRQTRWQVGDGPSDLGGDDGDDGAAGVREPRRPRTPPGSQHAAADLPGPPSSR